jgi:hypothetical protein
MTICASLSVVKISPLSSSSRSYFGHADRSNRIGYRSALRRQNVNLPQLGDDLLRRMSLPRHSHVLRLAQSHTSGRTISQGADWASP